MLALLERLSAVAPFTVFPADMSKRLVKQQLAALQQRQKVLDSSDGAAPRISKKRLRKRQIKKAAKPEASSVTGEASQQQETQRNLVYFKATTRNKRIIQSSELLNKVCH